MPHLINNCANWFDCNALIDQCKQHIKEPYIGNRTIPLDDPFYAHHWQQQQVTNAAGYDKCNSIEFTHYYPGQHFDKSFETTFAESLNVTPVYTFVSEMKPGKCSPWHYDINPWQHKPEDEWSRLIRFYCFIEPPKPGHMFIMEEHCHYWEEQGNIYQYPNMNSYHAGSNAGIENKYMLLMTAYRN